MASVHDVAAYIREGHKVGSRKKLLKLVYYAQAWSLAWDNRPLFEDDVIEAWPEGPVARALWTAERHRAQGSVGDPSMLDDAARTTIDEVIRFYGRFSGDQLSDLTHHEPPWRTARIGVDPAASSRNVVAMAAMRDYYGSLPTPRKRLGAELARGIELLLSLPPDERDSLFEESDEDADAFMHDFVRG